jgi:hypothetical protein
MSRVVELDPRLEGAVYFAITPGLVSGWVKPAEQRETELDVVDGDAVVCGSMVKHFNTAADADTLLQPHVVACRTGRRTTFVPPPARS